MVLNRNESHHEPIPGLEIPHHADFSGGGLDLYAA